MGVLGLGIRKIGKLEDLGHTFLDREVVVDKSVYYIFRIEVTPSLSLSCRREEASIALRLENSLFWKPRATLGLWYSVLLI